MLVGAIRPLSDHALARQGVSPVAERELACGQKDEPLLVGQRLPGLRALSHPGVEYVAGSASHPLPLFYCVSQAGRAICAAWTKGEDGVLSAMGLGGT